MVGRSQRQQSARDDGLCRRCSQEIPSITVRTEPLCKDCFVKYVHTKVVKRMESFRVRHAEAGKERVLLLPLSFGVCSLALLHILSHHLETQAQKTGRTGFKLHVLHVLSFTRTAEEPSLFDEVKARYVEHSYSVAFLSDILALDPSYLPLFPNHSETSQDVTESSQDQLDTLLASLNSASSKADVLDILQQKRIVHFARENKCEAIIWGHSTTRLAERTLAETANGRGASLPWTIADGTSPHGIPFYYPLRDLLTSEIESFARTVEPAIHFVKKEIAMTVSSKNATIDSLMRQYFESVERDYPSIVANVVKTTTKLQPAPLTTVEKQCELCNLPLETQAPERSRLCYGCIRTLG